MDSAAEAAYNILYLVLHQLKKTEIFITLAEFAAVPTDQMIMTEATTTGLRVKIVPKSEAKKLIEAERKKNSYTIGKMPNLRKRKAAKSVRRKTKPKPTK